MKNWKKYAFASTSVITLAARILLLVEALTGNNKSC